MNTDINVLQTKESSDTVKYADADLASAISALGRAQNLLQSTMVTQLEQLTASESLWNGESKKKYLAIKEFIGWYRRDLEAAVTEYKKTMEGLQTLLGAIPTSTKIKDISDAV